MSNGFITIRGCMSMPRRLSRRGLRHTRRSVAFRTNHRLGWFKSPPNSSEDHSRLQRQPRNRLLWNPHGRGKFRLEKISVSFELICSWGLTKVGDVVDVFMVAESNWTAGGDYKPLYLLPQLQRGFQRPYHSKILHVLIDQFPDGGLVDGWIADAYIRNCMGYQGLKRLTSPAKYVTSRPAKEYYTMMY